MNENIYVKMFGQFTISQNGKELSGANLKTSQLITLLSYMIYHCGKPLMMDDIYSILWPNENSDNPAHALRNLIYRARTVLKTNLESGYSYIQTLENNSYCWNKENTVCDAAQFEAYIKTASNLSLDKEERIKNYLMADEIFTGDFMNCISTQSWVIPLSAYYRHMYEEAVRDVSRLLKETQRYDEALRICIKASENNPFNEKTHRNIMDIYSIMGRNELAVKHYEYAGDLFFKELGVNLSDKTVELYKQIAVKSAVEKDIHAIKQTLPISEDIPLFCDYHTLKYLYSLQLRNQNRKNESNFLLLLTVSERSAKTPSDAFLDIEIARLTEILKQSLRKNDVVARYSKSQFLLMLSYLSHENTQTVKERIKRKYAGYNSKKGLLDFSVVAVD